MKNKKKMVTKSLWELQFGTIDNGQFYVKNKSYYIQRSVPTLNGKKIYAKTE